MDANALEAIEWSVLPDSVRRLRGSVYEFLRATGRAPDGDEFMQLWEIAQRTPKRTWSEWFFGRCP